jgi:hypothetical protein
VAASATVAPLIGLPLASFAVTVIVDVAVPTAIDVGAAATVDWAAEAGPAVTVTLAVWVMPVPLAVADTVFACATVELRVPVVTPLASVAAGWVRVLPLPLAASTTVAPLIGLPLASCTVTVIVALSLPAVSEVGDAATVDSEAEGDPTVTVTVAPCVTAVPSIVADTVFASATVELKVPVATPLALVRPAG